MEASAKELASAYQEFIRLRLRAGKIGAGDVLLLGDRSLGSWLRRVAPSGDLRGKAAGDPRAVADELVKGPAFDRMWRIWCDHGCDDYFQADDESLLRLEASRDNEEWHPAPYCPTCDEPAWEALDDPQMILRLNAEWRDAHRRPALGSSESVVAAAKAWAEDFHAGVLTGDSARHLAEAVAAMEGS